MPVRTGPGRPIAIGFVTVGGVVSIVGMFAPWVRTGAASRTSFELADLVARLGHAHGGPVGLALRTWPMAPLSVVVAVFATWWIGGRVAAAIAVVVGLVIGLVGAAVWSAPDSIILGSRWGCLVTAVGAVMMVAGGLLSLFALGAPAHPPAMAGRPGGSSGASLVPDAPPLEDLS
ncbi:MAG: hypothetical protein ABWZ42_08675 [Ilumatobacteraceae bacterium]